MREMTIEEQDLAREACPQCGSMDTEDRHVVGTVDVRGVPVEQEAWVTKCRKCGAQWSY